MIFIINQFRTAVSPVSRQMYVVDVLIWVKIHPNTKKVNKSTLGSINIQLCISVLNRAWTQLNNNLLFLYIGPA